MRTILKAIPFKHEDDNLDLVLAYYNGEYVVWTRNNEFQGYSHGHYFQTLEEAENKFSELHGRYCI